MAERKCWYVVFPTHQYEQDVKALAKRGNLKIVDARFDEGDGAEDVPKLTIKGAKPKGRPKKESVE